MLCHLAAAHVGSYYVTPCAAVEGRQRLHSPHFWNACLPLPTLLLRACGAHTCWVVNAVAQLCQYRHIHRASQLARACRISSPLPSHHIPSAIVALGSLLRHYNPGGGDAGVLVTPTAAAWPACNAAGTYLALCREGRIVTPSNIDIRLVRWWW